MEFHIEKHRSVSAIRQIQEQIKLAVTMGVLRSGDTLPSIRDVEKQTGINRGLVHRAYLDLRRSGLLTLARGKGTIISTCVPSPDRLTPKCRQLSIDVLSTVRRAGISQTAFARYLSQLAQENERNSPPIAFVDIGKEDALKGAEQISELWQVPVLGLTLQELNEAREIPSLKKVLANYFLEDSVKSRLSGRTIDVIPIATKGSERERKSLAQIKSNSSVLLVVPREAYGHAPFMVAHISRLIPSRGVEVDHRSADTIPDFEALLKNPKYALLLFTPSLHAQVPQKLRTNPRVLLLRTELDTSSLEAARIRAGVIIL
jgi:GntR family transcriptional regulator